MPNKQLVKHKTAASLDKKSGSLAYNRFEMQISQTLHMAIELYSNLNYLLVLDHYRIHLWCVWRDMEKYNILRHFQCSRFVPCSSIAAHHTISR